MHATIPLRSARSWTAALFALLAWATIAPAPVQAGCRGHWLLQPADIEKLAHLDALNHAGALSNPDLPSPHPDSSPRPCSGALCSGNPAVPAAPLAAFDVQFENWACLNAWPDVRDLDRFSNPFDEAPVRPSHLGLSVFHPPRLSTPVSL